MLDVELCQAVKLLLEAGRFRSRSDRVRMLVSQTMDAMYAAQHAHEKRPTFCSKRHN